MVEKIISILAEIKEDPELVKTADKNTSIIDDIGLDSLQMINFMLKIEEVTGVEIDFDEFDFDNLSSIQVFSDYLSGRM